VTAPDALSADFAALGDPRKSRQRPAAERLAAAAETDAGVRRRLVETLASADPRRRWGAAFALGISERPGPEPVAVLVEALANPDGDVRWAATRLLTRMAPREPLVMAALLAALESPSARQRKMALYGLRDVGAGELPAVVARLRDDDPAVRMAAMAALVALAPDGSDTTGALLALLDDAEPGVRRAAAATVGRLRMVPGIVVERLEILAAQSTDGILRRTARDALTRLGAAAPPRR
jgi:HEAT repeat protein